MVQSVKMAYCPTEILQCARWNWMAAQVALTGLLK